MGVLERGEAIVDIPAAAFFDRLDRSYPGARFVWTMRDKAEWLPAMERHLDSMLATWPYADEQLNRFTLRISERIYGSLRFGANLYSRAFDRHVERVESYFTDRPGDLLRIRVVDGDGWGATLLVPGPTDPVTAVPHLA